MLLSLSVTDFISSTILISLVWSLNLTGIKEYNSLHIRWKVTLTADSLKKSLLLTHLRKERGRRTPLLTPKLRTCLLQKPTEPDNDNSPLHSYCIRIPSFLSAISSRTILTPSFFLCSINHIRTLSFFFSSIPHTILLIWYAPITLV